jgi:hypothetical protein
MLSTRWSDFLDADDASPDSSQFSEFDDAGARCPASEFTVDGLDEVAALVDEVAPHDLPGEPESRTVIVAELPGDLLHDDRLAQFAAEWFGSIRECDLLPGERTCVRRFFDLRHARAMRLCTVRHRGAVLRVAYGPAEPVADPRKPPNNGTVVLFHVNATVSAADVAREFGKYGRVRQVRETPQKPTQKFVEYWDTRDAQRALGSTNGSHLFGARIAAEFSLPGGYRRFAEAAACPRVPRIEKAGARARLHIAVGRSV